MIQDMKTILTRLFTVMMLIIVSMGAMADVKVLFGEKGTELQPAKDGTITLGQKELTGGTIIIFQEEQKDGTSKVTFAVTPDKNYKLAENGLEVYAVIPPGISSTRGLEVSTTLTLKSEDFKDEALKRTYTTTIDSKLNLWVKSADFQPKKRDGAKATGDPVEITTDANGNGTIEDNEKKLYLIQTNAFQSFYIAPHYKSNNWTITTNNILGDYMLWYFLDAGEDGGTQYYYIVSESENKYICHAGGASSTRTVSLVEKNSSNEERCKFKLVLDESNGTTGFYNIDAKGNLAFYGLNKQGGSQANDNPIRLTNSDYIHDSNSKWKFIPFNETFTYPTPPFTLSDDSNKHYYEIHNVQKDTYYAATDATPDKVIFTNQANESRAWYLKEASSDTWYKYYYIINPATGDKYMYYNGTADNTKDQTNAISVKDYNSANEDRYQFVVVQAARGDGSSRKTCYAIIPKLLIDNLWTSSSIGYAQADITDGLNIGIINSRGADNGAQWDFKTTAYTTVCANPVIVFDRTTGKASITTTTLWPTIYYTTDGTTTPSSTQGTSYSGPFALTEQTTIKAIVTKDGYTDSEVTTSTIYKVATPTIQQETGTNNISITTTTPGATIYYTIDGNTPTTSSTLYEGASEELGGKPIKAIAVKDNMINSDIGEGSLTTIARRRFPSLALLRNVASTILPTVTLLQLQALHLAIRSLLTIKLNILRLLLLNRDMLILK